MSKILGTLEAPDRLFKDQTNFIAIDRARSANLNFSFYTTATTTAMEVKTSAGTHLAGSTSSLTFVSNSAGRFEGTFDESLDITVGKKYLIEVTLTADGDVGCWQREIRGDFRD